MRIGEVITAKGNIVINEGKKSIDLKVENVGERPIQVGSHFHFYEVNQRLIFDREKAYGYRLDIPSGTSVRFQGGETKTVSLVEIGGNRKVMGMTGVVDGYLFGSESVAEDKE